MIRVADYLFALIIGISLGRSLEAQYPGSPWVSGLVFVLAVVVLAIRIRQWWRFGQAMKGGGA